MIHPSFFYIPNSWAFVRYIIDHKFVDVIQQHFELASWCLRYLASPPLALTLSEEEILSYLKAGYFGFHEYISVHWYHHLVRVVEHQPHETPDFYFDAISQY